VDRAALDAVRAYIRDRYPRMPEDAVERRAIHGYAASDAGLRPLARPDAMQALIAGLRIDHPDELAAVACPITMVRGVDSAIVSPAAWSRSQLLAPRATWVEIDDADHYVPEEQPRAIATIIEDVLRAAAHGKD
ncbi:alpha/beta fold hydrolase, partial [Burkholderia cenocepacia]|uniref:alpha/beta fold hydrolase n=1 Tax=Burkholderia cenocepacia TaxID=95486 RepID=UPI0038CC13C1